MSTQHKKDEKEYTKVKETSSGKKYLLYKEMSYDELRAVLVEEGVARLENAKPVSAKMKEDLSKELVIAQQTRVEPMTLIISRSLQTYDEGIELMRQASSVKLVSDIRQICDISETDERRFIVRVWRDPVPQ